jgi:hypothetical protein
MISIVNYLFEFHGITDDMAFEAAKRIAKHRMAGPYDVDASLYRAEQAAKRMEHVVPTSASLADKDQLGIWSGHGAKSAGGKSAIKLLKKRFSE